VVSSSRWRSRLALKVQVVAAEARVAAEAMAAPRVPEVLVELQNLVAQPVVQAEALRRVERPQAEPVVAREA